jgi:hypothetical protein
VVLDFAAIKARCEIATPKEILSLYRCYILNETNRIARVEVGDCGNDTEAIAWGSRLSATSPERPAFELWEGMRVVYRQGRAGDVNPPVPLTPYHPVRQTS